MKILITGASGFIGSFIVEEAIRQGFETWAAVRRSSSKDYLQDPRIHFIELDLSSESKLVEQLQNCSFDYVVHAAGATQPTPSTLVLDKLSAIAVDKGVQPVVVCTKSDLAEADFLANAYAKSTLPFIRIDYESGAGLDEVKQWINGRLCAF